MDRSRPASLRDSCGWRGYAWFVRYADGGGLTAEGRARRERLRLQAAELFAQDADPVQIARSLRVSTKSVYQWRRARRAGGQEALASKGPGGSPCRLGEAQLAELRAALEAGPAARSYANALKPMYYAVTNGDVFILWNCQGAIPDVKVLEFKRSELRDRFDEIYRVLNCETVAKGYHAKLVKWRELQ